VYIAVGLGGSTIKFFRFLLQIENGISSMKSKEFASLVLGNGQVKDVVFLDDMTLLVLWALKDEAPRLLNIPYKKSRNHLTYSNYFPQSTNISPSRKLSNEEVVSRFVVCCFPTDNGFVPEKLEIGERIGKGTEGARLCVLGRDMLRYKVFTFPAKQDAETVVGEDVTMSQ